MSDTNAQQDDAELYYEAEYKLQNCLRIVLNVESFVTEVRATSDGWVPVTKYVEGLLEYTERAAQERLLTELETMTKQYWAESTPMVTVQRINSETLASGLRSIQMMRAKFESERQALGEEQ